MVNGREGFSWRPKPEWRVVAVCDEQLQASIIRETIISRTIIDHWSIHADIQQKPDFQICRY